MTASYYKPERPNKPKPHQEQEKLTLNDGIQKNFRKQTLETPCATPAERRGRRHHNQESPLPPDRILY